jgi:iron complex outermembrane receptor protein
MQYGYSLANFHTEWSLLMKVSFSVRGDRLMYIKSISLAFAMSLVMPTFVQGQDAEFGALLEEVTVTARKREESLKDVPVSISVMSSDMLREANIIEPRDLFALTPGLDYDASNSNDRLSDNPSIRGIQANTGSSNLQKVNTFLDGMPMIGSQGTNQFVDIQQVEVYRGPQSSAFGRSTFAGAINYVSRDPGDEFAAEARLQSSNLDRNRVTTSFSGPISDTLGYTLDLSKEQFDGLWESTEGLPLGGQETRYYTGKLKWTPNNRFDAEFRILHTETYDDEGGVWYANDPFIDVDEDGLGDAGTAYDGLSYDQTKWGGECTNTLLPGSMGGFTAYQIGALDCDIPIPGRGLARNTNVLAQLPIDNVTAEDIQDFAIHDPGSETDRNRFQAEFNVSFDAGDLQILTMYSEDTAFAWRDRDLTDLTASVQVMMGMVALSTREYRHQADVITADESMLEVRWVSPGEDRLRYVVGASYYQYDYNEKTFDRYAAFLDDPTVPVLDQQSDVAENSAIFGNIAYDLGDRTTVSFEARQQRDEVTNINLGVPPVQFKSTFDTFQPRVALTHAINENVSIYLQYAKGTNPGGNVPDTIVPVKQEIHQYAFDNGLVEWQLEDWQEFAEEELTNYEFGVKADLFDNRVTIATSIYAMDWEHYNQGGSPAFNPYDLAEDRCALGELQWCVDGDDEANSPQPWLDMNDWYLAGSQIPGQERAFENADAMLMGARLDLGAVELYGLEAEATWRINDQWNLRGALTLQESEFKDYCWRNGVNDLQLPPDRFAATSDEPFDCVIVDGNSLTRIPKHKASLSATYNNVIGNTGWSWVARLDWINTGESYADEMNWMSLPETNLYNGSLIFRSPDRNMQVSLTGRNLSDNDTPRSIRYANNRACIKEGTCREGFINPQIPREIGLQLSVGF